MCDLSTPGLPPLNEAAPSCDKAWVVLCNASCPGVLLLNGRCMPGESPIYPGDQLRIGAFVLEAQGWRDRP
jgi:hypothetical protein